MPDAGVEFVKLHGNGNDFGVVDEWSEPALDGGREKFARWFCARRTGVGADGVVFVSRSTEYDVAMELFQPDGDPVEMCGNALRCVARYVVDEGYVDADEWFEVETDAGAREARYVDGVAEVEMGVPSFEADDVPARERLVRSTLEEFEVTAVDTGVPHAVVFVEDADAVDVEHEAPDIRHHEVFPEGANVDFVERDDVYRLRTFERGVEGETLSCGTGAVAVAAVARLLDGAGDVVETSSPGGSLEVEFRDDVAFV
ncbi:MAG: diaminopimelate epimerase, partial [Halobacteriota archaeon]